MVGNNTLLHQVLCIFFCFFQMRLICLGDDNRLVFHLVFFLATSPSQTLRPPQVYLPPSHSHQANHSWGSCWPLLLTAPHSQAFKACFLLPCCIALLLDSSPSLGLFFPSGEAQPLLAPWKRRVGRKYFWDPACDETSLSSSHTIDNLVWYRILGEKLSSECWRQNSSAF